MSLCIILHHVSSIAYPILSLKLASRHQKLCQLESHLTEYVVTQAKQPASEAPKPASAAPAPSVDMSQLQAMLQQQQQAAQQLQVQQQAARMWPDQAALWQLAQLQQMMQGAPQQAPQMTHCSMGGLTPDTLSTLAQAQALQSMFGHAGHNPANNVMQGQGQCSSPPAAPPAGQGCGAVQPQFCAGAVPVGPPKARKSSAKLRKHTSAAKIAKPEVVRPATQAPGRPDAMSMMQAS